MDELSCDHLPGKLWPLQHSSIDQLFPDDPFHLIFNSSPIPQTPPLWSAELPTATGIRLNRTKKTTHNAYERDRRQKLNTLYSSLRSLLPDANETVSITSNNVLSETQRQLSIPSTIARVVKYIPELRGQVERLQDTKKNMLKQKLSKVDRGKGRASPMISAVCLNKEEAKEAIPVESRIFCEQLVNFLTD
ncbi:hypothetical protein HPP92_003244 [Vanilla planifolia]|uniref:BHLH domain-containing protein n=1 Tax=Vanilla planifolia TaxID=51239 RepID=A0A835RXA8_VANPL|nr:hypothetical protein HPP92_003244 [Vanilla planifolia]